MIKNHTMRPEVLEKYLASKVHTKADKNKILTIKPEFNRELELGVEKEKLFNYMRPTLEVETNTLHVFPGKDYAEHYKLIYDQLGYQTQVIEGESLPETVKNIIPELPNIDVVVLGYVEAFVNKDSWEGNNFVKYQIKHYGLTTVAYVGVAFSYWGDISYFVVKELSKYTDSFIYFGKLGSMLPEAVPNKHLATGKLSYIEETNETFEFESPFNFQDFNEVLVGNHVTLSSPVKETKSWVEDNSQYHFVDPEIGWMAKACADNGKQFSYLHLISDSLVFDFEENLSFEPKYSREAALLLGKSLIINYFYNYHSPVKSVYTAQLKRVTSGILPPLEQNWPLALSFLHHTLEEVVEVIRELPRKEWKDQEVNPDRVLEEMADVYIQFLTAMFYTGFTKEDLDSALYFKLTQTKNRKDWKDSK